MRRSKFQRNSPSPWKKLILLLGWLGALAWFCTWLLYHSFNPALPESGSPPLLYSSQDRVDLRQIVVHAIERSRQSIFLVMFGLSDPGILSALSEKVLGQLKTTVYYDPKGSPNVRKALPGGEIHPVKTSGLMHHKVLILDGETVFLGSTNLTLTSLKMHDNLMIGFVSRPIAHFLLNHLPTQTGHLQCKVGGQNVELWLLPDPRGHVLQDIRTKIQMARHSLKIALFTLTHPLLVDELIAAHQRGVEVTVAVDSTTGMGASKKAVTALHRAGVKVLFSQGVQLMHHKFVYIDDETLLTGSANWTQSAFCKNSDCFFALYQITRDQKTAIDHIWERIATTGRPCSRLGSMP